MRAMQWTWEEKEKAKINKNNNTYVILLSTKTVYTGIVTKAPSRSTRNNKYADEQCDTLATVFVVLYFEPTCYLPEEESSC